MTDTAKGSNGRSRGRIETIHVAPDRTPTPMERVEAVEAVAGRGLRGDRYFREIGSYDVRDDLEPSDLTLVEAEAIEAAEREYDLSIPSGSTRRNVTTRDVPLNHLVDREFEVGEATCRGIALCEPCAPMEKDAGVSGMLEALIHRGGLDAEIVESGRIRGGDEIRYYLGGVEKIERTCLHVDRLRCYPTISSANRRRTPAAVRPPHPRPGGPRALISA